jgi:hypothetical protein
MDLARIVIITGTNPVDLQAAAEILVRFLDLGCRIVSSHLDGTTFLYTLVNQEQFCYDKATYLKCLEGIHRSAAFTVTLA